MKTILVPIDFSECSNNALEFAAHLAKKTDAKIQLLHVLEVPNPNSEFTTTGEWGKREYLTSTDVPFMMALLKSTRKKMAELMNIPYLKKVKVNDNIETGSVAEHIASAAKKHKADMIIMGSHGTNGYNNFFIGSNTEKVGRLIEIPMLTIKHRVVNPFISKIAFATDFSEEAIKIFPYIKTFAAYFNAEIFFVKVITPSDFNTQRENREMISAFFDINNEKEYPVTLYNDKKKEAGIIHFADDNKVGIIAIGTHGKSGLSRFFSGSISEDLVNHSFLPVLTVNFPKAAKTNEIKIDKTERKKSYRVAASF